MEPRWISYLYYFNIVQDYYECHEYGESLWLDSGRPVVLKGMIQAAVCLYHLHNGNVRGGYRMWLRARQYIAPERPVYLGVDLDALTADLDAVFACVPESWRTQWVPLSAIADLHLPTVTLCIVDETITSLLPSWTPEPLTQEEQE